MGRAAGSRPRRCGAVTRRRPALLTGGQRHAGLSGVCVCVPSHPLRHTHVRADAPEQGWGRGPRDARVRTKGLGLTSHAFTLQPGEPAA